MYAVKCRVPMYLFFRLRPLTLILSRLMTIAFVIFIPGLILLPLSMGAPFVICVFMKIPVSGSDSFLAFPFVAAIL